MAPRVKALGTCVQSAEPTWECRERVTPLSFRWLPYVHHGACTSQGGEEEREGGGGGGGGGGRDWSQAGTPQQQNQQLQPGTLRKWRQGDHESKASLGYVRSLLILKNKSKAAKEAGRTELGPLGLYRPQIAWHLLSEATCGSPG